MDATTRLPAAGNRQVRLGPAEHSLLGLLADSRYGGIHGYDLSRHYSHGALGEIIRLEPGMLYHHLKKLDKYGLITTQTEHQPYRPDRHVHALTQRGRELLNGWLAEPVRATREIRLDFLLKLFFIRRLEPEKLDDLIAQQRSVLTKLSASLMAQGSESAAQPDALDRQMVLRLRLAQTTAALDWLDSLRPMEDDS